MQLTHYILVYLISVPVFIVFDLLWLGFIARDFYQIRLEHLLGPVNWYAAGVFYAIFLAGLLIFALVPALKQGSVQYALLFGALFGFFTYATYNLTNHATLRDWPLIVTVVDMIWGTFLGAVVAGGTYMVYTLIS